MTASSTTIWADTAWGTERTVALPVWNDPNSKAGTMVRGALWLMQEVGEGGTFTKEDLRQAFPGVAQADRRIRDLRTHGWVILASTEDATLMAEEQRFVRAGVPVWDPAARRAGASKAVTAKERLDAMDRDDFMCTVCGISGGDVYLEDSNQTAVLSATRRETVMPDGRRETLLVTECKRCRSGSGGGTADAAGLLGDIRALDAEDRRRLVRWMERGRRGSTPLDRAWNAYRRLPADARAALKASLDD
ncbi:hypothetical protein ACPA54_03545 [Uniformispora flossi]|uniref:hypothetical protein n=1 Tax=Uniformispora flossi TaxID=3390723 RepID=UPI003C30ADE1